MRALLVAPIRFYQKWISPILGPKCRFSPTCSQYAVEAITLHGVLKGVALSTWRICRCQPFCEAGHDPVPEAGRWRPTAPHAHE